MTCFLAARLCFLMILRLKVLRFIKTRVLLCVPG